MKSLINMFKWDLTFQLKYKVVLISGVITLLYSILFLYFDMTKLEGLMVFLILSDPSLLGFMFVGALILFEKSTNTLKAIVVTPLSPGIYLWSKALSLTLIAAICTFVMTLAAKGSDFNPLFLIVGVCLTSIFFVFLGFIGVVRVKSLNQFLIIMGNFLIPFFLPFLNYYKITDTWIFYILPTQASIFLLEATFSEISIGEFIYSIICLVVWIFIAYYYSLRSFEKYLVTSR